MNMIKAAVIGATGYTGQELIRILARHPSAQLTMLTSRSNQGALYGQMFQAFRGIVDLRLSQLDYDQLAKAAQVAFLAMPHTESQTVAAELVPRKVRVIDMSADFRFRKAAVYQKHYAEHKFPGLLRQAVFALPELYREQLKKAVLAANPGCFPTSAILGLKPLMESKMVAPEVIVDSKTGISGAGRSANVDYLFCEASASVRAYNIYKHRHQPEMEQELSRLYGKKVEVTFTPHLVPVSRGIFSTMYVRFARKISSARLETLYQECYQHEQFVRVLPLGELPDLAKVKGSNFCDIGLSLSPDGKTGIITAAIDNLVKGASGNAVQTMNVMFGLPEDSGLQAIALHP
jgi:N-acetyl-gamma-glutamyl-phosphate reductase